MTKKIIISGLLVLLWMIFIFIMSSMDTNNSNHKSIKIVNDVIEKVDDITNASETKKEEHKSYNFVDKMNRLFRKSTHASEYLILAILVFNFLFQIFTSKLYFYNLIGVFWCFLYACSDEYHQTFVVGRTGSFSDVLIDTLGAIIGTLIIDGIYLLIKKHKKVENE